MREKENIERTDEKVEKVRGRDREDVEIES